MVDFGLSNTENLYQEKTTSTRERLIKAPLATLSLAQELQNISRACRKAGISHGHFYEITEAFEKSGNCWASPAAARKPRMPNKTPAKLEAKILEVTEQHSAYMARPPIFNGVQVSSIRS